MSSQTEKIEQHQEAERDAFGLKPLQHKSGDVLWSAEDGKKLAEMLSVENPSGIHPVEFKVLVKLDPVEEMTAGGIIKPDMRKERDQMAETYATLIEVGGNAFTDPQWEGRVPQPGDRILINKYSGQTPTAGDTEDLYRLCNDKDIVAIIE